MAPPGSDAMGGYTETYVNDFTASALPTGWYVFTGKPGGDPGAQWAASHAVLAHGMLQLNTWRDPAYANGWVSGGVCQCGAPKTYGAFFVRSRLTGDGPNDVELLWPANNVWPPEIDFNETGKASYTSATVHFPPGNQTDHVELVIDTTQWHTWGVIWTPTSITYTVDGQLWATVTAPTEIPHRAMTLDLDQQSWCSRGWDCPTAPESLLIDWTAEYTRK
jgi:hypothetical protein